MSQRWVRNEKRQKCPVGGRGKLWRQVSLRYKETGRWGGWDGSISLRALAWGNKKIGMLANMVKERGAWCAETHNLKRPKKATSSRKGAVSSSTREEQKP